MSVYHSAPSFEIISPPLPEVDIALVIPILLVILTSTALMFFIPIRKLLVLFPVLVGFLCYLHFNLWGKEARESFVFVHETNYFFFLLLDKVRLLYSL